ncbi:MAG TPA: hypothetical protein VK791_08295 [bacterium]|jgi:hypothetical protein|nr:hypothetical protein [bacterium]
MDKPKKKKTPKLIQFLMGYSLGFISWLVGLHCLVVKQGMISISVKRFRKHLFKVFLWTLEIGLLLNLMSLYRGWILGASTYEIELAFIVKSVIFLYVKVFWPRVFPEILPGMHIFFCPQCYQKQTFKFLPVGFQFGFFVTYLCKYCSCLVNGWGEQIFYPETVTFNKVTPSLIKTIPAVLLAMALGVAAFQSVWQFFN